MLVVDSGVDIQVYEKSIDRVSLIFELIEEESERESDSGVDIQVIECQKEEERERE